MSRIYFHSPSGTAEVSGRERAHAGLLCHELLCVALGINGSFVEQEKYRQLLPADSYLLKAKSNLEFFRDFCTWMFAHFGACFQLPDGTKANVFETALNTTVAMGSEPMRLLAKLHGQCEIHAYVEGPNRAWLADIIEQGIEDKILRVWEGDCYGGWPAVVELLRSRDDEPVVTSYSVTDQFPNRHVALQSGTWDIPVDHEAIKQKYELTEDDDLTGYEADYKSDTWYELPDDEQWRVAMAGLRKQNEKSTLEMKPETFARQGYGNGMSGFDIIAAIGEV